MKAYAGLINSHERPFIVEHNNILIFGAEHSKNSKDEQNKSIEALFNEFKPTVVLIEGRLGFHIPFIMNPVKKFGEMGLAASLAKEHDALLYSWETPKGELINQLRLNFSDEQIILKEILTPYFSNLRFGKPDSPENFVEQYLDRAQWLGLQDRISNIEDLDSLWNRDFSNEKDWRETSDQYGLPGYLVKIGDHANYIRNQNLLCNIKKLIEQNERVFVVCGSSHAVCIKNEIEKL